MKRTRLNRKFFLLIPLFTLGFLFVSCGLFDYNPGGNLTFTGRNKTGGSYAPDRILVSISGGADSVSLHKDTHLSPLNKYYTSFTGLTEGDYLLGVDLYNEDIASAHGEYSLTLLPGQNLEVSYIIEYDGTPRVEFLSVSGGSGTESLVLHRAGTGVLLTRDSWPSGTVSGLGILQTVAVGDFKNAAEFTVTNPDGSSVSFDPLSETADPDFYLNSNADLFLARQMLPMPSGQYSLAVKDANGLLSRHKEEVSSVISTSTWGTDQVPSGGGALVPFLNNDWNTINWSLTNPSGVESMVLVVARDSAPKTCIHLDSVSFPGNTGSFDFYIEEPVSGGNFRVFLFTLDKPFPGGQIFDNIPEFNLDMLSIILLTSPENYDAVGILAVTVPVS